MSRKAFITELTKFFEEEEIPIESIFSEEGLQGFYELQLSAGSPTLTIAGSAIIRFLQKEKETYKNRFKIATIAAGIDMKPRAVAGAIRKLVHAHYVQKNEKDEPVSYSLTEYGCEIELPEFDEL